MVVVAARMSPGVGHPADMPTLSIGVCLRGRLDMGEVNRHFRQLTMVEIFEPRRPRRCSKITGTQQIPQLVNKKTFDALNFLCV